MARALILSLAFAAIYYFAFFDSGMSQKATIQTATSRVQELQKQIHDDQDKLDRAAIFKKTVSEVGSTVNKLLSLIPEKFGMPDLMRIVSNEAKVAGSSLSTITPNGSVVSNVAKEFDELSVTIDLTGSFLQHMIFLSNLTKVSQILIIKKFDLTIAKEGHADEPAVTKMVAEIVAYRYRGADSKTANPPPGGSK